MNPATQIRILPAIAAVLLLVGVVVADELRNVKPGEAIPAFTLPTLGGKTINSETLKEKALVLVFLSAHQTSSEAAASVAHRVIRDLRRDDLTLLFVTADTAETAYFRQQRDRTNVHAPFCLDFDRKLYGGLGLIVLPTTVVVNREGRLQHVISSYKSDYEHVLKAYIQHTLGLIDDARLEQVLKSETFRRDRPNDKIARHRAAAKLLRKNGLVKDSENELNAALQIDANHADTLLDLASLYLAADRIAEADALVERVMKESPYHRRGKLLHGIVLYKSDRLDEAESVLRESIMLNPDPVQTHYYLGLIYEKKGDTAKALEHYREALSRALEDEPI